MEEINHRADENRREQPNLRQMESGEQGCAVWNGSVLGSGGAEAGLEARERAQNLHFSSGQVRKLRTGRRTGEESLWRHSTRLRTPLGEVLQRLWTL